MKYTLQINFQQGPPRTKQYAWKNLARAEFAATEIIRNCKNVESVDIFDENVKHLATITILRKTTK